MDFRQGWIAAAQGVLSSPGMLLAVAGGYVVGGALAGRRFGARGVWAACAVFIAVLALQGVLAGDAPPNMQFAAFLAVGIVIPAVATALLLASTSRQPQPVGLPVQIALASLVFALALPLAAVCAAVTAFLLS